MAFFRSVSLTEQLPALTGDLVMLRAPQMSDHAEWSALRELSRDFLTPWEPIWPADDLTRAAFRRRIRRYAEDQRNDLDEIRSILARHGDLLSQPPC
jgi:ribosomal-protein-alanine N-acetyltransferase